MPFAVSMAHPGADVERLRLLLVGDASLERLRRPLTRAGYEVERVGPAETMSRVRGDLAAVVLAGERVEILRLCRKIKERVPLPFLPVLALLRPAGRLPQEPTAPDAWLPPASSPREVVGRVEELVRLRRADAEMVRLNAALAELAAENGMLYDRARREAEATATLLRELQHRVRNNLAAIQALLVMERHRSPRRALEDALDVAIARLRSMAALQDCLTQSGREVSLAAMAAAIGRSVCEVFRGSPLRVEVTGDAGISPAAAGPMAMVLNELISNARRHSSASVVSVAISEEGPGIAIDVCDNGTGLPGQMQEGSGLMIARTVVRNELGGTLEIPSGGEPARLRLWVPRERVAPARAATTPA